MTDFPFVPHDASPSQQKGHEQVCQTGIQVCRMIFALRTNTANSVDLSAEKNCNGSDQMGFQSYRELLLLENSLYFFTALIMFPIHD